MEATQVRDPSAGAGVPMPSRDVTEEEHQAEAIAKRIAVEVAEAEQQIAQLNDSISAFERSLTAATRLRNAIVAKLDALREDEIRKVA